MNCSPKVLSTLHKVELHLVAALYDGATPVGLKAKLTSRARKQAQRVQEQAVAGMAQRSASVGRDSTRSAAREAYRVCAEARTL